MLKKNFMKISLGIFVSGVFMCLILRHINLRNSLEFIGNINYFAFIPAVFIYAFTYILRSVRYYFIILPLKKTCIMANFPYTVLGFFANNVLPLRLGELIRAKTTGERFSISRASALATIVMERIFDVFALALLFFVTIFFMSFPEFIKKSFYILTTCLVICLVLFYIMLTYEKKILTILSKISLAKIIKLVMTKFVHKFTTGLIVLKNPTILIKIFIISVIIWIVEALCLVVVAYACGIQLSILGAIFTVIIIGVGAVIPAAPGYFGAFELMGVLALYTIGIDKNIGFACTVIYHLLQLIVIFILGFACMIKIKFSFSNLFKFSKIEQ
ncbi:MAG: flippase-like domain-containing protein [Endomicrobium sp.]|jgi:uncharacterized protein (TIRG00374 family)|nr:flippase-like domain-containing protein [Endomicrobium sp.]